MEENGSSNGLDREKTAPFLIRCFVKTNGFHRTNLFEDGTYPTTDEYQIFTWKNATLKEVLTTLRDVAAPTTEFRHPLARYTFKALYADPTARGAFTTKDLGTVYSRDILGEPGSLSTDPEDIEPPQAADREREDKTLDDLRFSPGDFMLVGVMMPKTLGGSAAAAAAAGTAAFSIKGSATGSNGVLAGKWGAGRGGGDPWNGPPALSSRGGGHWRGRGAAPVGSGRGGAPSGGENRRTSPPPPPPPAPRGLDRDRERGRGERNRDRGREIGRGRDRGYNRDRAGRDKRSLSRSLSRERSPPPRRNRRSRSRSNSRGRTRSPYARSRSPRRRR